MKIEDEVIRAWIKIFSKHGRRSEYTNEWELLDQKHRNIVVQNYTFAPEKIPVIASVLDPEWSVLTTRHLIWYSLGSTSKLALTEIKDTRIDLAKMKEEHLSLIDLKKLEVLDFSEKAYKIPIENGYPFCGIWNILKFIATTNRRDRTGSSDRGP